ncbi:MAG: AAA family ATPase [Deltaproteobacteria bacterium]|jgi:type II secretory pathway predicted ATPase ExeA|nr:AAA family ATPase [Deltaproteobacteria bacterium]
MDYETFFSLRERPFKSALAPRFFFPGPAFARLASLLAGEGGPPPRLIVVTGGRGSGKTSLLASLVPPLLPDSIHVAAVLRGAVTLSGILSEALNSMGLMGRLPPGAPEETLLGFFQNAVSELVASGATAALAVDDAQLLGRETLADLPGLMAIEPSWAGRTSLILCGTEGVGFPGALPEGAELVEIPPLTPAETGRYVSFRLKAAGARRDPFTPGAVAALHALSRGLPGDLNPLAERSLMTAWSLGRKDITSSHVGRAAEGLSGPPPVPDEAAGRAAGGSRQRGGRPRGKPRLLALGLAAALLFSGWFLLRPGAAGPGRLAVWGPPADPSGGPGAALPGRITVDPAGSGLEDPAPGQGAGPAPAAESATPAAVPSPEDDLALPSPPPALLSLPRNSLVLVVDGALGMARLWQGSLKGPGLKAEISPPDIRRPGLYLVGRPQSRTPLIFQYPPAREIPREAGISLWRQVEAHLPQDILPLMAGEGPDLRRSIPDGLGGTIRGRLRGWIQAQEYKLPDNMAALYAERFRFFEPGSPDRTIDREQFRTALASELRSSGDVKLTASEPLILLDPRDHNRAWAVFNLKYDSRLRHDLGQRTLIFEKPRLGGDWLVTAELWVKESALAGD